MSKPPDPASATGTGTVTPERFARVRAIFEAALDQPARDRRGFVAGACVGDAALLREVEAMLAADATGAPLLDRPSTPSSSAPEEGRFPAGTVLAGRYRILGRLGQGGMGEVYRAHDLILNQTVALKFLAPAHLSEAALARFRNEVRIARQVSHPNVCRVYDLGMVEGLHFLSMEYIDGEDLASLLRRIGRLPQDKAIEFTRKICAGLGAAHERGVLHRDLKPANIMIDGRGQPRITDFGLAGLAAEIPLSDLRSGTPAYMSPEQKAGKDVTVKSDLYSLGLVLHEMFTGKARKDTQSSPSELVKDLDPAIERLILRCLEEDPKRRPVSAFNVAMALPGADPIAAALAAGETPSPEMVAASQAKEGFSPRIAWLCFATVIAFTMVFYLTAASRMLTAKAAIDVPPDALAITARDFLKDFGYPETPPHSAYGFDCCIESHLTFVNHQPPDIRDAMFAAHRPPVIRFWYRQQRTSFRVEEMFNVRVSPTSPPMIEAGMALIWLDPRRRLIGLEMRPTADAASCDAPCTFDWTRLFRAAGLDPDRLTATMPSTPPPMVAFDSRMAWTGAYPGVAVPRIRIEAAAWQGRPVYFVITPDVPPDAGTSRFRDAALGMLSAVTLVAAVVMALRNLRTGRGDRRGARVIAGALFLTLMSMWVLIAEHTADVWEFASLARAVAWGLLGTGLLSVTYLAIEPSIRRHWPDSLISWTRLYSGRIRDPLVASHILAGLAVCAVADCSIMVANALVSAPPRSLNLPSLDSAAMFSGMMAGTILAMMLVAVQYLLTIVVLRSLLKRVWIADILASVLIALTGGIDYSDPFRFAVTAPVVVLFVYAVLWLMRRFGFVAMLADWWLNSVLLLVPPSLTAWYTGRFLVCLAVPFALAAWALWVVLSDTRHLSTESAT